MIVAIDFETVKVRKDGSTYASPDFWHPDFRVLSCAFTFRNQENELKSLYIEGEDAVGIQLAKHLDDDIVVHNLGFEWGVLTCRYPHLKFDIQRFTDTMRLVQNYDGGGRDDEFDWVIIDADILTPDDKPKRKREPLQGLGLAKCARRILNEAESHKKEAHDWIYANIPECKPGKAGKFLDRLPKDILERYNIADTEITLRLYDFITKEFKSEGIYDWNMDRYFYNNTTKYVVEAKITGVPIDREALMVDRDKILHEILTIESDFRQKFLPDIEALEYQWGMEWIHKPKSYRGKCVRFVRWHDGERPVFNVGSNRQLQALFMDRLGIQPKFFTDKGNPSFKSSMLGQWGDGGNMLKTRRKKMLLLKQTEALLAVSEDDGLWHLGLKVAATATGRLAGGG
jgi:hypothetical protein